MELSRATTEAEQIKNGMRKGLNKLEKVEFSSRF